MDGSFAALLAAVESRGPEQLNPIKVNALGQNTPILNQIIALLNDPYILQFNISLN
jgi:hypothetical protein